MHAEIESMATKVLAQYAVLGQYNFFNIVEAPSNKSIAKPLLEHRSRGTIQIITLMAIPVDDFITKMM
jgi:uncharacterized protein with GYD domain